MRKMPCLFVRSFDGPRAFTITEAVTPEAQWVADGEGRAFIKRDGTACMVKSDQLFKRYDAKEGKTPPPGAIPCDPAPDETTGHWPHWVEVRADDPSSKWHWEAWRQTLSLVDGTYELCGPAISANPEKQATHCFIKHDSEPLDDCPRDFASLKGLLRGLHHEGIVFPHPDARMATIRRPDFGLAWPVRGD